MVVNEFTMQSLKHTHVISCTCGTHTCCSSKKRSIHETNYQISWNSHNDDLYCFPLSISSAEDNLSIGFCLKCNYVFLTDDQVFTQHAAAPPPAPATAAAQAQPAASRSMLPKASQSGLRPPGFSSSRHPASRLAAFGFVRSSSVSSVSSAHSADSTQSDPCRTAHRESTSYTSDPTFHFEAFFFFFFTCWYFPVSLLNHYIMSTLLSSHYCFYCLSSSMCSPYEYSLHKYPPPTFIMLYFAFSFWAPPHLKCNLLPVFPYTSSMSCSFMEHILYFTCTRTQYNVCFQQYNVGDLTTLIAFIYCVLFDLFVNFSHMIDPISGRNIS